MSIGLYSSYKRPDSIRNFKGPDIPAGSVGDMWFDTVSSTYKQCTSISPMTWASFTSGGAGASDHGALTGLADDDHAQYLNNARGDARYSALAHAHTFASLSDKPTTLSGYGITDAQPLTTSLTNIGALAGSSGIARKTGASTWTLDTATYLTSITSGNVTTALGFTPYNATNPAGYTSNIGTVTSVGVSSANAAITVTSSPVTSSGTIALTANNFTTSNPGVVPASGGGTANFLRADGTWAAPAGGGGGGAPGGSTSQVQFNNAGAFAGAANVSVNSGDLVLVSNTSPTVPSAGTVKLFDRDVAGRQMLAAMGPSGLDTILAPHWGRNKVATWNPAGNGTAIVSNGAAALTATGAATAANVATTNLHTMQKRVDYLVTTAAATAVAGFRYPAAQWTVGASGTDGAKKGGFHMIFRWAPATGVATATNRAFVGMANTTAAPTDVEPSTITNIVGCGWDAADTNIQIMHRGTGAITKIDTGIAVPLVDRTSSFEIALFSRPGTTQSVGYLFTDNVNDVSFSGDITTNLPTATTLLAPRGWMSVGGTSSVIGITLMSGYLESDY